MPTDAVGSAPRMARSGYVAIVASVLYLAAGALAFRWCADADPEIIIFVCVVLLVPTALFAFIAGVCALTARVNRANRIAGAVALGLVIVPYIIAGVAFEIQKILGP